jgi:toxin ParE1/3/4
MKKHEIIWTEFAVWNLDQIYDYVLSKSFSESTANKLIRGIILRTEQLQLQPNSGQQELELTKLKKTFRYLVYKNYKIIYFTESTKVYITDVFHCKISPSELKKRNL